MTLVLILLPHIAVSLNMRALNQVLAVHEDDLDVVVQPGMTYAELNQYLKPHGLFFPLDPGPGASIGGMINTSCSGPNAVRHGTAKENVISLKVVTPDGRIVKTRSRAKKSCAGYDLTHLFVGSEGTLGVVVEATLKLQRIPPHKSIALCTFDSVKDAADTVIEMLVKHNVRIGKVELLDDVALKAVNIWSQTHYTEKPTLLFEFSGFSETDVNEQIGTTRSVAAKHHGGEFKYATSEEERDELWRARKEALWAAPVLVQEGTSASANPPVVLITDACVPVSRLADVLAETQEDIKASGLYAPIVAHAGDGNFHLFVVFDKENAKEVDAAQMINENLVKRAIRMEGTCTGEHGVGSGKRKFLESELGENAVELMRTLKKAVDPNGIMNPHKVIPDPKNSEDPHGSGPHDPVDAVKAATAHSRRVHTHSGSCC
jgi:D-lactate dehydrogenase (cytochrome)